MAAPLHPCGHRHPDSVQARAQGKREGARYKEWRGRARQILTPWGLAFKGVGRRVWLSHRDENVDEGPGRARGIYLRALAARDSNRRKPNQGGWSGVVWNEAPRT